MKDLIRLIVRILLAIAVVCLLYYVVMWVLGLLSLGVPEYIVRVVFVIIGLMAVLAVLDNQYTWFSNPKA